MSKKLRTSVDVLRLDAEKAKDIHYFLKLDEQIAKDIRYFLRWMSK